MNTIGELAVVLGADISGLQRDFNRAGSIVEGYGDKIKTLGKSISGFGRKWSMFVTAPLLAAAGASLKFAADMEATQTAFGVFVGSASEGKEVYQDLVDFSARTPLQLKGVTDAGQLLLATGIEANELTHTLEILGNAARGDSNLLQRMALNLGQVATQGKLTGRELRDFAVAGVPLIQELAKNMGVTTTEMQKMVSSGDIGFKQVIKAFESLSGAGGRFENLMEKIALTVKGKFTTALDNVKIAAGKAFDSFLPMVTKFLDGVIAAAKWFDSLSQSTKKWVVIVLAAVAAVGPLALALGGIISVIGTIVTAIGGIISALPVLLTIVAAIAAVGAALVTTIGVGNTFGEKFSSMAAIAKAMWDGLGDSMVDKAVSVVRLILAGVLNVVKVYNNTIAVIKGSFETAIDFMQVMAAGMMVSLTSSISGIVNMVVKAVDTIIGVLNKIPNVDIKLLKDTEAVNFVNELNNITQKHLSNKTEDLLSGKAWKNAMMNADLKNLSAEFGIEEMGNDFEAMVKKFMAGFGGTPVADVGARGDGGGTDIPSPGGAPATPKFAGAMKEGSIEAYRTLIGGNKVEKSIEKNTRDLVREMKNIKDDISDITFEPYVPTEDW